MPDQIPEFPTPGPHTLGDGYQGEIDAAFDSPALRQWLLGLKAHCASDNAELVYRVRNRILRVAAPAATQSSLTALPASFCIKAFKTPSPLRSFFYSLITTKAARSYLHSEHLRKHGVGVPQPIAYSEKWLGRQLVESYFVTEYLPDLSDLYSETTKLLRDDADAAKYIDLLGTVACEVRRMHDCGFAHNDLGGQNIILRRQPDGRWGDVGFIDLNRGRIHAQLTMQRRARDLAQLEIPSHFRNIFFHQYFDDGAIPSDFARWERLWRARITLHNESRKYRHPIRTARERKTSITVSLWRPAYRDTWLWDDKSGQPSVVHAPRDRHKYRANDTPDIAWQTARIARPLYQRYQALRQDAYTFPVDLSQRFGIAVEVGADFSAQLALLADTPCIPVFVRCYFHKGDEGLAACVSAITQLQGMGHEVALGLIQSRRAVLEPAAWQSFLDAAMERLHDKVRFVEIGHAVNRVKWGTWGNRETLALWDGVAALKARYPQHTILGPAVNDFEYQYYPPLLARLRDRIDGLSCHLYVDRRGAPESGQSRFSLLEKCVLGRAMAETYGKQGFYITETNWPMRGAGDYSPVAGAYTTKDYVESSLHVDESTYAAYMIRYALIALCSGMTERIWWWRLAARGYGLVDDIDASGRAGFLRPRIAWQALVHYQHTLGGARFERREEAQGAIWWHFDNCLVVYALTPCDVMLPDDYRIAKDMCGTPLSLGETGLLLVGGQPVYVYR